MQLQDCHTTPNAANESPAALRGVIDRLHALEPATAHYLDALAFILMRVADADDGVCEPETRCMEHILADHVDLPENQAILVVEIARHRLHMADAGCAYEVSRDLRHSVTARTRVKLIDFLEAVAAADGETSPYERASIRQIAWELGFRDERSLKDA